MMDQKPEDMTLEEFKSSIPKSRVSALLIISFALILGPTLFAGVAGFVAKSTDGKPPEILMTINFILAALMFVVSKVTSSLVMKGNSRFNFPNQSSVDQVLNKIQGAHIVRLALVEGPALFGCVCVLLGLGYVNYISLIPLYLTFITNIPTEKYICRQFIVHIKKDPRLLVEIDEY